MTDAGLQAEVAELVKRMEGYCTPYKEWLREPEQRAHLVHCVSGMASGLERKSAEPIAFLHGLPRRLIQNFVGLSRWDCGPLRKQQRSEVNAEIGMPGAVLMIDGSATPKKGKSTVGVARQWCGRLGKVDSCVVGVHAAYLGKDNQAALVDSQLFLPDEWVTDMARRAKTHVPADVEGRTKVQIAMDMAKSLAAEMQFRWVTADEEFGRSTAFRDAVRAVGREYVLEVPRDTHVKTLKGKGSREFRRVDLLMRDIAPTLEKATVHEGEKGPIQVKACMMRVRTARTRGHADEVLIYVVDSTGDHHYYLAHASADANLADILLVALGRHRVEEVFQEAKGEVGMDHFECRSWHGWHHHMTLTQLTHWFLVREQRRLGKKMSRTHARNAAPGGGGTPSARAGYPVGHEDAHVSPHAQQGITGCEVPREGTASAAAAI